MAKAKRWINERTIFLLFRQLIKTDAYSELLQLAERLQTESGMHISTRLLNAMLRAARLSRDYDLAQRLFTRFAGRTGAVSPDLETIREILLVAATRGAMKGTEDIIGHLRRQHAQLMEQAASDAELARLLRRSDKTPAL